MAEINKFKNPYKPGYDIQALRHDVLTRLLNDHVGPNNSVTTAELTKAYFGYVSFENKCFIGQLIQACRQLLEENNLLLRSHHFRWYVVPTDHPEYAKGFIDERAARFIRSHQRLQKETDISVDTYKLPASDKLVKAIRGAAGAVEQIEEGRHEAPKLPEVEHKEDLGDETP